ncbi:membrane protein [Bathymodiolus azoricus thioautotrophic gill symbiont]|uniref:Membrane protein n=1 Tax=Bathymodiolus azoricus thioautotrophic gill symbiont TaxID=235205 RepID=A0A1H6M1T3_9GAMM|nr:membrane protein [Bathymodiolus azoricus thioautotrophic gill symbiont]
MSDRYLARKSSAESTAIFLPFGSTLVLTSLTLTLALLIPLFCNLDRSFIAYSPFKSQGTKLTFLTLESSPVACSIVLIYSAISSILLSTILPNSPCALIITLRSPFGI